MSKNRNNKNAISTENYSSSTFTLSFVIEVLNVEETECKEGWFDLGPCVREMRMHYQIYPNQSFDIDISIWPNIAKVWCGNQQCFVRTWQHMERRWLAFTIRHVFPVRVADMINNVATITPGVGVAQSANARNDKNTEACLAPLRFLELAYFGRVLGKVESLEQYVRDFIWERIEPYVPSSHWDGPFDTPVCVTDLKHQNKILELIREIVGKKEADEQFDETDTSRVTLKSDTKKSSGRKSRSGKSSKLTSKSKKSLDLLKQKYELRLPGTTILAGIGQVVPFDSIGPKGSDMGEVLCVVSSNNLPANEDMPIIFVVIKNLVGIPLEDLRLLGITQLFLTYRICDEIYCTEKRELQKLNYVVFNYYNAVPLPPEVASMITSNFLDNPFEVEIYGVSTPNLFETLATIKSEDIPIGVTKIDASQLAKGPNCAIKGEYFVNPFVEKIEYKLESEEEINQTDNKVPRIVTRMPTVPSFIVLKANMSLDVTIGVAGCRPKPKTVYSRLYCLISNSDVSKCFTKRVSATNENIALTGSKEESLTGFSVDVGDHAIVYVEGPQKGPIGDIVKFSFNFPEMKVLFSMEDKYSTRLYPEISSSTLPFVCLTMRFPIYVLLKNSDVYVRSDISMPARKALLKIGCLVSCNLKLVPNKSDMPTFEELESFKHELCHLPGKIMEE
ncbi:uncharacterized protein LOC121733642 [Aricia agestis]|uniref:uncharacterized protein LOC121733642 n=1 Tax=Aricia agestis TaxID=91739 RepID=UPI001C2046C0|nr:uncharacterized protein LOC121733642 [Aricia agestis]